MKYLFDRVSVSQTNLATDHLNMRAEQGYRPIFFYDMGSHTLGIIFENLQPVKESKPLLLNGGVPVEEPKKKRGRPKKATTEA